MKQIKLAASRGFDQHARHTHRTEFLERMDALAPWAEFYSLIEPVLSQGRQETTPDRSGAQDAHVLRGQLFQPGERCLRGCLMRR